MVDIYVRGKKEKIFDTMDIQSVKLTWQICIQSLVHKLLKNRNQDKLYIGGIQLSVITFELKGRAGGIHQVAKVCKKGGEGYADANVHTYFF